MSSFVTPIQKQNRIVLLDVFRGLAIFGILMVNMPLFFNPIALEMIQGSIPVNSTIDNILKFIIKFFFEGKFIVLFSLLFGYGFWIFLNKPTENQNIVSLYSRRVIFLILFGVAHIILLWAGDILFFYGLFGLVLILFRNVRDSRVIKWAISFLLIPSVLLSFAVLMISLASLDPTAQAEIEQAFAESKIEIETISNNALEVYSSGTFVEMIKMRVTEWSFLVSGGVLFFFPVVLAAFLIGMYAARRNLISNYKEYIPFFKKLFWWTLFLGVPLNLIYAYTTISIERFIPSLMSLLSTFSMSIGGIIMTLCYISSIILLSERGKLQKLQKLIAPVGRMALTNYLSHSLICSIIFLGFGLYGKTTLLQGILLTIAIYIIQIPLSNYWLKKFYFGPMEWLWRSLTYLKLQPFKIRAENEIK